MCRGGEERGASILKEGGDGVGSSVLKEAQRADEGIICSVELIGGKAEHHLN